jgi:hypothetical protein
MEKLVPEKSVFLGETSFGALFTKVKCTGTFLIYKYK